VVYTTSSLGAGSHLIVGSYSGDRNYAASQPSPGNYILINGYTAAMTLTPASNPAKNDQPLQVTLALAQSGTNPVPTGTVTLVVYKGSAIVFNSSAMSLANGSVSITIPANALPIATLELYAIYNGDKNYNSNTASANIQIISSGTIAPTVAMTPPTGVQATYPFSIPVKVSGPSGSPTATGSVSLNVGGNFWGTQSLVNGSTAFPIQSMPGGANSLTASYTGDSNYTGGTVTGVVSVIALPLINFVPYGQYVAVNQPLTFAVAITANTGNPIPAATGTVIISSGSYKSATTALNAGSASFTIPANSLAVGLDDVTATYSGDANYLSGTNDEYVNVTAAIPPGITLSGTNVTVAPGALVGNTSTITVSPAGGFTGSVSLTAAIANSPTGAVDQPTFSFGTTSPVMITGAGSQTATLTVSTTAATVASLAPPLPPGAQWRHGAVAFACLMLFGIGAVRRGRRTLLMLMLLVVLAGGAISCGGGGGSGSGSGGGNSNPRTTPGSYTVTVTATSGTISATTTINLQVN
jgi:hypothetical protein